MTRSVPALAVCLLVGCSGSAPDLIRPERPRSELRQANVLLRPVPGGTELLGRAVTAGGDGSLRIAPERTPGCRVELTHTPSTARERSRVQVRSVAALDADYMALVGLGLGVSQIAQVELDVAQSEVVSASLAGPCGANVITTVYIGRGSQSFFGSGAAHARVAAGGRGLGVNAGGESEVQIGDAIVWDTPSAYAYEYRALAGGESIALQADLPSQVRSGDLLDVSFEANRAAYLIVFSVDDAGEKQLLWPSNEEPNPRAAPGAPAHLPSSPERERGYRYRLALPAGRSEPAHEALLVFAFAEKGDFDLVHPQALGGGPAYAAALDERLAQIPVSRWSRFVFGYTLLPGE
jgi:Domain of unknown function (DUF4384)